MIGVLIVGILFGYDKYLMFSFLLIYSTQIKSMGIKSGDYFNSSVKAYFGIGDNFLFLN